MFIPYHVDVPMERWPVANWVLLGCMVLAFGVQNAVVTERLMPYVLQGWSAKGLFGHIWLHGGLVHLVGNMLFLWLFGNAVCAKIGNGFYVLLYLLFGLVAASVHLLIDGDPAIGASGAVNGVVGMFLVFYPRNDVTCWFFFGLRGGTFSVSSLWLILLYFILDIVGTIWGGGAVAYAAHVGGFLAGFALACALLVSGRVQMAPEEESFLAILCRSRARKRRR